MEKDFEDFFFTEKDNILGIWVGGGGCGIHITRGGKRGIGMCFIEYLFGKLGKGFGGFGEIEINMEWRSMTLWRGVMGQKLDGKVNTIYKFCMLFLMGWGCG